MMRLLAAVALLLCLLPAQAAPTPDVALAPYEARYTTKAMGLNMTLRRTLEQEAGHYTLRNRGEVLVASLEEVAHFTLDNGRIRGQDFTYKLRGLISRTREVKFDPEGGVIMSLKKKRWTEHPWSPEVLDRLSQQEQLRLALMSAASPPPELSFSVIDGPRVRTRVLELVGEEVLETEAGRLNTVRYRKVDDDDDNERSSEIWLATDHDYLMVLTRHFEKGTKVEIELVNAAVDGELINPEGPPL